MSAYSLVRFNLSKIKMFTKMSKSWFSIVYYKRYVDDIFIIIYTSRINDNTNRDRMNSIDKNLESKITLETNNSINYLDMTIIRSTKGMDIYIENALAQI